MLAAVVLASWLAQAEPAPAETTPSAASAASVAIAPAPAPPSTPDNAVGVYGGWGRRLGSEAQTVGPANGISVGGSYQRRYLTLLDHLELGAGLDFFYDKYETDVTGSAMVAPGEEQTFSAERIISQASFALTQTVAWRQGRVRPFAQLGLGFAISYFSTPEIAFRPGSFDAAQPLGRGSVGLDVRVTHDVGISVRAGYTLVFTHPAYMPGTTSYSFLGDSLDVDLGVFLPF
ncbi:MAG TPA: hypothetical protein VLC06_04655 [Polyangia bacterium]|jgi:hypothetical protein|nr:hypothetical protein [Polyangia bacterium]